jgi:hypothetical protein
MGNGIEMQRQKTSDCIVYSPKILRSLAEITKEFRVGHETVRAWIDAGAPVVVELDSDGRTRYSAETMRLQVWRECQAKDSEDSD